MELILKETISSLGQVGDIVKVKPGYGRNYLLPKGKAVIADAKNKALLEKNRASIEARLAQEQKEAEAFARKLSGIVLEIQQLVGEDERLFGSVTSADLAQKLAEKELPIDKKQILLSQPIKTLGEFQVPVKIGFNITTEIKVTVSSKDDTE